MAHLGSLASAHFCNVWFWHVSVSWNIVKAMLQGYLWHPMTIAFVFAICCRPLTTDRCSYDEESQVLSMHVYIYICIYIYVYIYIYTRTHTHILNLFIDVYCEHIVIMWLIQKVNVYITLIDWLTDWLIVWLMVSFFDWLVDCLRKNLCGELGSTSPRDHEHPWTNRIKGNHSGAFGGRVMTPPTIRTPAGKNGAHLVKQAASCAFHLLHLSGGICSFLFVCTIFFQLRAPFLKGR